MSQSISSEELQHLIAGYALGDLDAQEATVLEQLIAANPSISKEIDQMQQALELSYGLSDKDSETQPPEYLQASVISAYKTAFQPQPAPQSAVLSAAQSAQPVQPTQLAQSRRWWVALAAVAALLIAGLGINNYSLRRSLYAARSFDQTPDNQTPQPLVASLVPVESESSATATVIISPNSLEASLETANLPPLSADQVYVLWTVLKPGAPFTKDAKNAILTQVFTVDQQGAISQEISLPPAYEDRQWIQAIAITAEAAEAPQDHESSPVLKADVDEL
ncbi:MAG: anti-sigma factor [Phormidesmis sp.]